MAIFDDGIKAFLEAYTYFSTTLGKGREKLAKELAEQSTGVKAPEKLEPVIPGSEVIRIPSKVEKGELMSINSTFSNPLKSDFVLSKIDGTAGSKYAVLKSELDRMSPKVTQDLQYAKDNQLALTTAQKNNLVQNVKLERELKQELKRLETDLIADKKDPQMIYDAYTQSVRKQKIDPTETYSKAKADLIKQNNVRNKYDSRAYNSNYESAYRQIARNFLIAEQKAGRIEMPTNIYQRISSGGLDAVIDPIKLFRYHYGDDAFDKIPVDQLEEMFAKKGLREQDYKYALRQAGITPIKQKGPKSYAAYATPKELKAELLEIDTVNDEILAGDSPIFKTKTEIVNAIKNNNDRRAKFATILKDMEFKKTVKETPIVNLSKYTDQDLNKLVKEAEEINSQLSLVDQDGSSTLPYQEFQQLSKRKAEIDKIITEAQKVPDLSGNFANDLATKEGDNVVDIEDYFDKDDMARGGIVSIR
jgi:hypothetical protein